MNSKRCQNQAQSICHKLGGFFDSYVKSDLDQTKIWKIIFSHGCSPASGQPSSAGHCWHLQEASFQRPLLYPLLWNSVTQSLPAHGLKGRTMASCCPAPQVPAALAGAGLKHCFTVPVSQRGLAAPTSRFWAGMSPSTGGTKHCCALAPGWHPAQWHVESCQGAHDHRTLAEDAARQTEKKHFKTFNLIDLKIHFKMMEKQMRLDTSIATLRTSHRHLSKIFISNRHGQGNTSLLAVEYQNRFQ